MHAAWLTEYYLRLGPGGRSNARKYDKARIKALRTLREKYPGTRDHKGQDIRDRALRELAYGRAPFTEALTKRGLPAVLRFLPWAVIIASFVAAAGMALAWFEG